VKLTFEDRMQSAEVQLPIKSQQYGPGIVPHPEPTLLDGNVGYMWFQSVTSASVQMILEKMPQFRTTKGLVLDLRENFGGAPDESLAILAAFLLPPENHTMIARVKDIPEEQASLNHRAR
jgi:C-terminal processing protease CtpA/Prc